jgi:hypothetical protein
VFINHTPVQSAQKNLIKLLNPWRKILPKEHTPFDFINAASQSKEDLIGKSEYPSMTEKEYVAYIVNRGFSYHDDTILHANEMNQRAHLFPRAQFDYYRGVLRPRKRFSKWHKAEKDADLDAIQKVYSCNRTVAKMYFKALSSEQLKTIHSKLEVGGEKKN